MYSSLEYAWWWPATQWLKPRSLSAGEGPPQGVQVLLPGVPAVCWVLDLLGCLLTNLYKYACMYFK